MQDVTYNEFIEWQVKEYIAELSGKQVNWAEVAAATTRWKLDRIHCIFLKMNAKGSGKEGNLVWISGSSGFLQPLGLNGRLFGAKKRRQRSSGCRPGNLSEFVVLL
jgi:hypothetical protein